MARWAKRWQGTARRWAALVLVGSLGLAGCGKTPAPSEQADKSPEGAPVAAGSGAASADKQPDGPSPKDGRHEPFAKATRGGDDPPPNINPPPDVIANGKAAYKVYKEVVNQWDAIRFATADGKSIAYTAVIETDQGDIEIALRPDLAPNHVRNFVALARAGYYDQLFFDRVVHEEEEVEPGKMQVLDSIEAGCPLGTGDPGNGSIGYWLKPEIAPPEAKVTHEPGTVGACHGAEPDTAACRFYITLCDAPFLDGNFTVFGKVTRGLDVARKIMLQPVILDDQDAEGSHRPEKPVKIKKVTIHSSATEAAR